MNDRALGLVAGQQELLLNITDIGAYDRVREYLDTANLSSLRTSSVSSFPLLDLEAYRRTL